MSFYKYIEPFVEYVHSIRKLQTHLSFDMKFPSKWSIPKSLMEDGQVVPYDTEEPNTKLISFVSAIEEQELSKVISKINKIIKLNKEREIKEVLFKKTIEELKKTFEQTDLEKLKNLYFDFNIDDTKLNHDEPENKGGEDIELVGE